MLDIQSLPIHKQFIRRLIKPDTWLINSYSASCESPNPYVLIGEKYALVIDTTDTRQDLRKYIETVITDKPLLVASTHSHFDHTLCNGLFNDCPIYMSPRAWEEIQAQRTTGYNGKAAGRILGDYTPILLQPGDQIDLGGRIIEAVGFGGCHSMSSISYLDKTMGLFFPGDEMEAGQILMQGDFRGGGNSVELYREQLLALKLRSHEFDMICPPHNGSPIHVSFLDILIENCDRIMSGIEGDRDIGSISYLLGPNEPRSPEKVQQLRFDPKSRRSEWKGSSIVYSTDRIFKA